MKLKKLLSAALAALLLFTVLPVSALVSPSWELPEGYNANDYSRCVAFLEQTDEEGVKNGEKLDINYTPNDPNSWGSYMVGNSKINSFRFEQVGGEQRLVEIKANASDLVGVMDLTDCTELVTMNAVQNRISGMVVNGCTKLEILNFLQNEVSELDVSTNIALRDLGTADNPIDELDLSNNPQLHNLFTGGGNMAELDLSHNPQLPGNHFSRTGSGSFGYMYLDLGVTDVLGLVALPQEGGEFIGWYDGNGNLISQQAEYNVPDPWSVDVVLAVFSGGSEPGLPGDVDGNGSVSVGDAILALRASMQLIELDAAQLARADMNGDGAVGVADAIMILRVSMGLA